MAKQLPPPLLLLLLLYACGTHDSYGCCTSNRHLMLAAITNHDQVECWLLLRLHPSITSCINRCSMPCSMSRC